MRDEMEKVDGRAKSGYTEFMYPLNSENARPALRHNLCKNHIMYSDKPSCFSSMSLHHAMFIHALDTSSPLSSMAADPTCDHCACHRPFHEIHHASTEPLGTWLAPFGRHSRSQLGCAYPQQASSCHSRPGLSSQRPTFEGPFRPEPWGQGRGRERGRERPRGQPRSPWPVPQCSLLSQPFSPSGLWRQRCAW